MWCLNPNMKQMGVGHSENRRFAAQYVFGKSRRGKPDLLFHAYPAPGYFPKEYFRSRIPWSIAFNPRKYSSKGKEPVKVEIFRLNKNYVPVGPALPLNYHNVTPSRRGPYTPLIFRPKKLDMSHGARYWVKVTGIEHRSKKIPALSFIVEFIDLKRAALAK